LCDAKGPLFWLLSLYGGVVVWRFGLDILVGFGYIVAFCQKSAFSALFRESVFWRILAIFRKR
jgi:hypothetical protein